MKCIFDLSKYKIIFLYFWLFIGALTPGLVWLRIETGGELL
jgi:hypothetical protein